MSRDEILAAPRDAALDRIETLEDALDKIKQWSEAYPIDIFKEPDLEKAHRVLTENGMTLGGISAHVARHVVKGVGDIARTALAAPEPSAAEPETIRCENERAIVSVIRSTFGISYGPTKVGKFRLSDDEAFALLQRAIAAACARGRLR